MGKKLLAIIAAVVISCGMLLGCKDTNSKNTTSEPNKTINTENSNNSPQNTSTINNNISNNKQARIVQVPVTIINGTDVEFSALYASSINIKNWGSNIANIGTFSPGSALNVTFNVDANNLKWDLKAVDYHGASLQFNGLDLSACNANGVTITLTYNHQTHIGRITAK